MTDRINPYSPPSETNAADADKRPLCGEIGFLLAVVAFVSLWLPSYLILGALLSVPALLLSIVGLFSKPRKMAVRGFWLSLLVGLYVPTILLPWM